MHVLYLLGTAALHLALRVLGVGSNDKVICPTMTFAASANVILYQNAIPVFIDIDPKYWTIDLNALEMAIKKTKPKVLITVDLYGQSCDYDNINFLCEKYNVLTIEDAAEALGGFYKKTKLGNFGDISIVSFNGNKIITTSGGGMIFSKNKSYIQKSRFLSTQAREPVTHYEHKELGYNYRMSNVLASIGRGQLLNIESIINKRRLIYDYYFKNLSELSGVNFMEEPEYSKSNRWLTTLTLDKNKTGFSSKDVINALENKNIESRPVWKPMHLQPLYKEYEFFHLEEDYASILFKNGLCLPSGTCLSIEDQNRIIDTIYSLGKY